MKLVAEAHAKINIGWLVDPPDSSGYHPVQGLIHTLDLHDRLVFSTDGEDQMDLSVSGDEAVGIEDNLILRAADALRPFAKRPVGTKVTCEKRIPSAAGLGGGSADAAATLVALNLMWSCGRSPSQLRRIGAELGSDVPAILVGGLVHCDAYGERVRRLGDTHGWAAVLVKGPERLATPDVYARFDTLAVQASDRIEFNALQQAAVELVPTLEERCTQLRELGGVSFVTGSGPTCVGIFGSRAGAENAAAHLESPETWIHVAEPTENGVMVAVG